VGSALRALRTVLESYHVEVELGKELALVEVDAVLIERVLSNLLENVAKYAKPGTTVRISAGPSGDKLLVSVRDEGPGLPPGQEEKIFEKFARGERDSATSGVGLGLSICRAIVDAHSGKIWAQNNPEGGATFFFTLPLGMSPELPEGMREPVRREV
jgi:two-component system sensor histidine kinase KdpD